MNARFDLAVVAAGMVAYGVAVVTAALLVFVVYRANAFITREVDEEGLLRGGHRSIAISLGAILLSQAVLLRHAVQPVMVMVRELFLEPGELLARAGSLLQAIEDATLRLTESQSACVAHEASVPSLEGAYQAAREAMTAARAQAVA